MLTFSLNKSFTNTEVMQEIYPVIKHHPFHLSSKGREWLAEFCLRPIDGKSNEGKANNLDAFAAVCDLFTYAKKISRETAMLNDDEANSYSSQIYGMPYRLLRSSDFSCPLESSRFLEDFDVICEVYRLVFDHIADELNISFSSVLGSALTKGTAWGIKKLSSLIERFNDFEELSTVKYLYKGGKMTTLSQRVSAWMQDSDLKTLLLIIIENDELLERLNLSESVSPNRLVY